MRAKDVANEIGITRQELRQELQKINFGVDPDAKDIPDSLASGIVRVLGVKYKDRKKQQEEREALRRKAEEMAHADEEKVNLEEEDTIIVTKVEKKIEEDLPKHEEIKEEKTNIELKGPVLFRTALEVRTRRKEIEEEDKKKKEEDKKKAQERQQYNEENRNANKNRDGVVKVVRKIELDGGVENGSSSDRKRSKRKENFTPPPQAIRAKPIKRFRENHLEGDHDDHIAAITEASIIKKIEDEVFKASQAKRRFKLQNRQKLDESLVKKDGLIEIGEAITVKEFSEKAGIPVSTLVGVLLKNGIMAVINTPVDYETWAILAEELDVKLKKMTSDSSVEDLLAGDLEKLLQDEVENLQTRPPVVVVMGHVDHGKTSILDYYRKTSVVSQESGGITQHVGAYQVEQKNKLITFIDTPGHEAFTEMRARGAKVTDIAILVVAADEGIKAQTEEAYNHAKEANVPIIVAVNKIDKPEANVERVKGELMNLGIVPEDYGGDTMVVGVSAKQGDGMDDLLDAILLQAEIMQVKANPNRAAIATVVESHLDKRMEPVATIIVNTGTLNIGDTIVTGGIVGKI
ncbi:MAG TPA: translation initiation factor IF-2 N-terminal domain-containing protein, partial [Candidatus Gracilibacteria bacterium]|nr:translation initiation factor IF-2 N-terminal domain-containing protein [Candidatus Gracilibacteria bacterium]